MVGAAPPFRSFPAGETRGFAACVRCGRLQGPLAEAAAARCTADLPGAGGAHAASELGGGAPARGVVAHEPRRGDCCLVVRTSAVSRASLSPARARWSRDTCGAYGERRGWGHRTCECSRPARGAPRRLSAGAALSSRGALAVAPRRKADEEFPTGRAAFAPRPATARTTIPAESTRTTLTTQARGCACL